MGLRKTSDEPLEMWFYIKDPDQALDLLKAQNRARGSRGRTGSYLGGGEYFTLAIDLETMNARIVSRKESGR